MNNQRNYNTYLNGMEKGNSEKLFFLNELDLNNYDTVIDFGCGGGDVLKTIYSLGIKIKLIGIDLDDYMRETTKRNCPAAEVFPRLTREMITNKTLIIFNSVLHEVEGYWKTLKDLIKGTGATVAVRDMRFIDSDANDSVQNNLAKLVDKANHVQLAEFIRRYGIASNKDITHYLLKYAYIDNWDLEVKENYFSFDWNDLINLGTVIYERNYVLDFKKNQAKKHFDIDLKSSTHCQMIIKLA